MTRDTVSQVQDQDPDPDPGMSYTNCKTKPEYRI